ncbi:DCP2-domain-containing protein [Coprinopsis marcescibilis]|uniref:DCP2-domain-containing protein n=1 Tax=Coprinopsis marcescibilis TaxID=230819 RepID=A0A5C3LD94_COPMA|nr:DCP2-domain-containing protein [Coprinopsis marcescibilis]
MASSSSTQITNPYASETTSTFSYRDATEEEIIEDLTSRFILNLPDEELASLERICFQVEQAHWYYEDFIREENPRYPSVPLKKFTAMMFTTCPVLQHWNHEEAFDTFMRYKTQVPVCGAIMLNETWDKCVLVKGWKSSSGWGFPKGKINEVEGKSLCAIREVLEETGYNLAGKINPDHYIEIVNNGQTVTLFIVPGVPEDYEFRTKTRKEISKIEWFRLIDLPSWRRSKQATGKFYLIAPFIQPLKAFVNANKPRKGRKGQAGGKSPYNSKVKSPAPIPQPQFESDGIQDSSSQSSSLDNGEPQTPSPLYAESTAAFVPKIVEEPTAPMESLDPHFARLLSGLTMSAGIPEEPPVKTLEPPIPPDTAAQAPSTPTTLSTAAPRSPPVVKQEPKVSSVAVETASISTVSEIANLHETSQITPAKSPQPVPFEPRSPSMRTSSTADISPYLPRAVEIPSSARRLQQLALLESVANESAQMVATLSSSPGITGNNAGGPPQSFTPHIHNQLSAQSAYYQTQPMTQPFSNALRPLVQNHDAFVVRSRTSQAFHRAGFHSSPGSMSMNQHQLLSLINGAHPTTGPSPPPQGLFNNPYTGHSANPQAAQSYAPMPGIFAQQQSMLGYPSQLQPRSAGYLQSLATNQQRSFSTAPMTATPNPSANVLLSLLNSIPNRLPNIPEPSTQPVATQ